MLYEIESEGLRRLAEASLSTHGIRERQDLQRLLRDQIEVVDEDLLVIAEEFGEWDASRRRIDLLAIDRAGNLVVIELKRDESGGHMDLQALRYAAMVSTMTFSDATNAFAAYLEQNGQEAGDAAELMLEFLGWDEPSEDLFAQDVRIVLVASDFGRELTTAVLWLNERDLDIRCVRLRPYADGARVLLDIQQVIPLPEAADFQVRVREKSRSERKARSGGRDLTRYDVSANGQLVRDQPKRGAIYHAVQAILRSGGTPEAVAEQFTWRSLVWVVVDGTVDEDEFNQKALAAFGKKGRVYEPQRWFTDDSELFHCQGKTYAFTKMWGGSTWLRAMEALRTGFPQISLSYAPTEHVSE